MVKRKKTFQIINYFSVAQQPNQDLGRLIVEVSGSHTIRHTYTHTRYDSSERVISPGVKVATYTRHNRHKRRIFMPSAGFEPAIPAIGPQTYSLRPHGHQDQHKLYYSYVYRRKHATFNQHKQDYHIRDFRLSPQCNVLEAFGLLGQ